METAIRWSPHRQRFLVVKIHDPTLTLNEVDLLERHSIKHHVVAQSTKLPSFSAFDWSKTEEAIIALGHVSGSASLVKLHDDGQPSETVTTFRIKQQRKCNSIAFSKQDWLAVAVDKTRSDICLFIYDASRGANNHSESIRKLCAGELVSSVKFFSGQPQEMLASTQRSFIRLYDLRDGLLGSTVNLQAPTRNVNNIAIDPLDENYFASAGTTDDPCVTIWDRRWMSQHAGGSTTGAIFDFKPLVNSSMKTSIWSLKFSGQQRGRLGVCSSAGELKIIDAVDGTNSAFHAAEHLPVNPHGGPTWTYNRYVKSIRNIEQPWHDERYGRNKKTRIMAFDWVQDRSRSLGQGIVAIRANAEVDLIQVPSMSLHATVTSRQELSITGKDISSIEPQSPPTTTMRSSSRLPEGGMPEDVGPYPSEEENTAVEGTQQTLLLCEGDAPRLGRVLTSSTVQYNRCKQGYLFDCYKNMSIVAGNQQLQHLWEFVHRFRVLAAEDGMLCGGLDLSYLGVFGIWSESFGSSPSRRVSLSVLKPEDVIVGLNTARNIPSFEGHRTNFAEHRQLCLAICGWKFTRDSLEEECQELIERGLYYQAIVQAVLHDEKHIALNLLRTLIRNKTIQNIGLGALIASDQLNEEQRDMCLWMSADTDDPALKALLTFLNTGGWRDVMKTPYLHLGYRIALALKYLSDTELSGYIQGETRRATMNGDLEGVLLTGLGEQAMDLFQKYITQTNDLQTAVLATAYTNPIFVDDLRWEMWKETYFSQMQAWRCFVQRTMFTVQHNRMAQTRDGRCLVEPLPAQVTLKCTHCRSPLGQRLKTASSGNNGVVVDGPAANAGTICHSCGRHLPRCGICKMWLGTPNPSSSGGARELSKLEDIMAKFITFCVRCGHGFHADHAKSWFARHGTCPVPDCRCLCGIQR